MSTEQTSGMTGWLHKRGVDAQTDSGAAPLWSMQHERLHYAALSLLCDDPVPYPAASSN